MRINRVRVNDILGLEDIDIELRNNLAILVGENGAGKSNLIRVLDLVRKAGTKLIELDRIPQIKVGDNPRVEIDIELKGSEVSEFCHMFFVLLVLNAMKYSSSREIDYKKIMDIFEDFKKKFSGTMITYTFSP